ncbi:HIT domain-containing protein [Candidatus Nomurabacteria bacterium]|nr:HIT domain-containing protein [Candidatus Nomurabacteria bacterium]
MNDCVFCKIIKGELPSSKIYEDADFLSFLTKGPVSDGHLLIVPKKHTVWMQDVDDETISKIFKLTKKLMLAVKKGMGCDYVQVSVVGKDVPHFHIHLIPRYLNNNLPEFPTKEYKDGERELVVNKITQAL